MKRLSFVALLAATTALVSAVQVHAQTHAAQSSASPQGAQLVSGAASVTQTGATETTITQTSQQAILNWQSFSIDKGNTVNVLQPGATSVLLNRVTGNTTSNIAGQLNANGQVFLINPNGIVIGKTGVVQAAGFVASTLDISDQDFLAGKLNFKATGPAAAVVHDGTIRITQGGYAALLGGSVSDTGTIIAPMGQVAIGAGSAATLDLSGDGFLQVALAGAGGTGTAVVSAADARDAVRQTVNTDAADAATSVSGQDGHVVFSGRIDTSNGTSGGAVKVLGTTLDLSGGRIAAGNALVETSGDTVNFTGLNVSAGDWLVDPTNLTIDSMAAATISSNLATTDVTLQTTASGASGPGVQSSGAGDIVVTSAITWGSTHQLTLNAYHGISIDAPITITGAGQVSLLTANGGDYDFAMGTNGFGGSLSFTGAANSGQALTINGQSYTLIYSMAQLDALDGLNAITGVTEAVYGPGMTGSYALAKPLDGSGSTYGQSLVGGKNESAGIFVGTLEGLGNSISHLTIYDPADGHVALVGSTADNTTTHTPAVIRDIAMFNETVTGQVLVGGLLGSSGGSNYSSGGVDTVIKNAVVQANVSGGSLAVSGDSNGPYSDVGIVGGDLGAISLSRIITSGTVQATATDAGGIVGFLAYGTLSQSSSSATILATGSNSVFIGGLVGEDYTGGNIVDSFATGNVTGVRQVGGLVGLAETGSSISNAYSTGYVTGLSGTLIGGLVGENKGTLTNGYWDTQTSGKSTSGGGTGLTTAQLQGALPGGFSSSVWGTGAGLYPYLKAFGTINTAQGVAGYAFNSDNTTATGATINLYTGGASLTSVSAGANGYYYYLAQGTPLIADVSLGGTLQLVGATAISGASFTDHPTISGGFASLDLTAGAFTHATNVGTYGALQSQLLSAFGSAALVNVKTSLASATQSITASGSFIQEQAPWGTGSLDLRTLAGDLSVISPLVFRGGNGLILDSSRNLSIQAPITVAGTGQVKLLTGDWGSGGDYDFEMGATGFAGSLSFTGTPNNGQALMINGQAYTLVYSMAQLDAIDGLNAITGVTEAVYGPGMTGSYALAKPLDGAGSTYGQSLVGGKNESAGIFVGTLEGLGNSISHLTIYDPADGHVALVGSTADNTTTHTPAVIRDIAMFNETVTGQVLVGGLLGSSGGSNYSSGGVDTVIKNAVVQANVSGGSLAVSGDSNGPYSDVGIVGGDLGAISLSRIITSGTVQATATDAGGIVGFLAYGTLSQSSSSATILATGSNSVFIGGLVGEDYTGGNIVDSFATGNVTGVRQVGGLVGLAETGSSISNAYSTGHVTGLSSALIGGLVGESKGTLTNGYWDTQTSGQSTSGGGAGKTTAQLQGTLPAGFDPSVWGTGAGLYPYLKWQYSTGVQVIGGYAYTSSSAAAAGASVSLYANGAQLGSTAYSDANGYYYDILPTGGVTTRTPIGTVMTLAGASGVSGLGFNDTLTGSGNVVNNPSVMAGRIYGSVSLPTWSATLAEMGTAFGTTRFASLQTTTPYRLIDIYGLLPTFTVDIAQDTGGVFKITEGNATGALIDAAPITVEAGGTVMFISNGPLAIDAPITIKGNGLADLRYDYYQVQHSGTVDPSAFSFGAGDSVTFLTASGATATAGQGATLKVNDTPYTLVYTAAQLDAIDGLNGITGASIAGYGPGLGGYFALADDLSASGTTYQHALLNNFYGTFEGLGHAIGNLTFNYTASSTDNVIGLFGALSGVIRNLNLVNLSVTASDPAGNHPAVGGLVGYDNGALYNDSVGGDVNAAGLQNSDIGGAVGHAAYATIKNVSASDTVEGGGGDEIGGLIGLDYHATITGASSTGRVSGGDNANIGGLIGYADDGSNITLSFSQSPVSGGTLSSMGGLLGAENGTSSVSQSFATGGVSGTDLSNMGGLVGIVLNINSTVSQSYAKGNVSGNLNSRDGGLVGYSDGAIDQSYATGNVTSAGSISGGFAGYSDGSITQSYSLGNVSDTNNTSIPVGGFIGINARTIGASYAAGGVSATDAASTGGFAGSTSGTFTNVYWNATTSGLSGATGSGAAAGATGLSTTQLQSGTLPTGFSSSIWAVASGHYPKLKAVSGQ